MTLELQNPHSILAALEARPGDVLQIAFRGARPAGVWEEVAHAAERAGVPLSVEERQERRAKRGRRETERAGSVVARVREKFAARLEEILPDPDIPDRPPGIWLALDCLQDPHNVGAIFRTAAFFGVQGILTMKNRASPIGSTVYDISAGGVEAVPHAIVANLRHALDRAREAGVWILGTSEHASQDVAAVDRSRDWLLVIGNEAKGLRRLTLEGCDEVCRLAPRGKVTSLNASVAAGALLAVLSMGTT
jgi:23S rRNA (guanosine2251-2'-O)-methyltransferase